MSEANITLPDFNIISDVRGVLSGVRMSLAGNQWFVIDELMGFLKSMEFNVYVETIPPGLVLRRALGEPLVIGGLVIDVKPEIVSLPTSMLSGLTVKDRFEYVENDLAIAYVGEPVNDWCELRDRRVAVPNPVTEGIGALFREIYTEYCGDYSEFVGRGSVYLTRIHHREIPELLRNGLVDAGVVWRTEAIYWGFKYTVPSRNRVSRLSFALMPWASNDAVKVFELLRSDNVRRMYEKYGFRWIVGH
ncbi:putative sulfate-binding protein [Vulcanisaeta moutnovskia 768-28]|uniref:Sulfate-binding protein n=1 Tax=Vulcanisaeta moutnovskia (strain 768-28) TaxID=985053 RepID=F0QX70_VULM7|nr:substrate-binding domain-containing protein [Vulcanisaeta moutnovskia]ADY02359.1 putative sulfate-binding protein [Vulcanisaeta moutnovskia 768-28]